MLSFRFFASRHQDVCSLAAPPAVGSGAPLTDFISENKKHHKYFDLEIRLKVTHLHFDIARYLRWFLRGTSIL